MFGRRNSVTLKIAFTTLAIALPAAAQTPAKPSGLRQVENIVVLYMENRSFDHMLGNFPGANGLANAGNTAIQVDESGNPYEFLPEPLDLRTRPFKRYEGLPERMANKPFRLDDYFQQTQVLGSLIHAFHTQQDQIAGGLMNRFAVYSDAKGYAMATWDGSKTAMWDYARRYTLADNFFHAAFGGSFLNHFWLVCACTPLYPSPPADIVVKRDAQGRLVDEGFATADGYAVNTMEPVGGPHDPKIKKELLLPVQTMPTIGDRLSAKKIPWAWYSGGWREAEAGQEKPGTFSYHHQPLAFFQPYQKGQPGRARHLKDLADFEADIDGGKLPPVAFYKPRRGINQHPSASNVKESDQHLADLLARLEKSPQWKKMVVVVTYDENGGFWDHVSPPKRDRWGPGVRVPALVISPFAKKGHVDHTPYDTTSILKLIENRFGLAPLGTADGGANGMTGAFVF
ncbi:MAG: sulfatase-like hydrolase/transferase [Proteobacteria bacterium]|nr:sulfatase-like hydrolase/transferase [Pseudomonadota bacterium]